MKRMIIVLAVAATSVTAFGQPPKPNPNHNSNPKPNLSSDFVAASSSSVALTQKDQAHVQIMTPFSIFKPVVTHKVHKVDGMSSRPWVQEVGIHPGWSAFPRPEMENPSMPVITVSFGSGH